MSRKKNLQELCDLCGHALDNHYWVPNPSVRDVPCEDCPDSKCRVPNLMVAA